MTGPLKAHLTIEGGGQIDCLFNPSELTVAKSNSWKAGESKGRNAPELRFQGGQSATLSLSLTFDTTDKGSDVSEYTGKLLDLMKTSPRLPGSDPGRNSGRPPWVQFHWGKLQSFKAIVEKVQIKFTYFASDGMPLRAKVDLSLKQWNDEDVQPLQNPTSSTPLVHTVHTLLPGETLDRVAARRYQDPTRWRLIAEANNIIDPLEIPAGTALILPEPGVRHRA
jgi:nucleoid-associated protein YgaU